jgi:hypothetical protein
VTYQVVDKNGTSVPGVSVQEHVTTLAAYNVNVEPNPDPVTDPNGTFTDVIGPKFGLPEHETEYLKTEQTFTAYQNGTAYPLSTKVNQYFVVKDWKVSAAVANIIVP